MIAIIGATGNTGRGIVDELRRLGEDPVCIVRDMEKAQQVLGTDARSVVAELTDPPALERALSGVERVFVVTGHNPHLAEQQINALKASKAAGAQLFIKVSSAKVLADPKAQSVVGRGHYAVEEAMRKSGLDWVILRPGLFMQNTFQQAALIKAEGKLVLPFAADLPIAFIDGRDTGALGARICLNPSGHIGKELAFTGALSSFAEFAAAFSEVIGKTVTYVAASPEQVERALRERGLPEWLIAHQLVVAGIGADGAFSEEASQPIRQIVGRAPLTVRQFVEDHKDRFT